MLTIKLGNDIMNMQRKLCNDFRGDNMDKKEILKKAQQDSEDEGLNNAMNLGRKWGVYAFLAVYIVITVFNFVKDKPNDIPTMFFMAYLACESIPQYAFTKKKIFLITAICASAAAIVTLVRYMIGAM